MADAEGVPVLNLPWNAHHLAHMRNTIFELPHNLRMSKADWEKLLPFVDNIYARRNVKTTKHYYRYLYSCRQARPTVSTPGHEPRQFKTRKRRTTALCRYTFKIHEYPEHVEFYRLSLENKHNHTLDDADRNKRPSHLRRLLGNEIIKGYAPATAMKALRGKPGSPLWRQLQLVGGKYLANIDGSNAAKLWKEGHPDPHVPVPDPEVGDPSMQEPGLPPLMVEIPDREPGQVTYEALRRSQWSNAVQNIVSPTLPAVMAPPSMTPPAMWMPPRFTFGPRSNPVRLPPNTVNPPPNSVRPPLNLVSLPPNQVNPPPNTAVPPPSTAIAPPNTVNSPINTAIPPLNTVNPTPNTMSRVTDNEDSSSDAGEEEEEEEEDQQEEEASPDAEESSSGEEEEPSH